jgi:helix-turn-helix protein
MDPETFNISLRKFLKTVGVGSQREIEQAVDKALADGRIAGSESFPVHAVLEIPALGLNVRFDGEIKLQ